jgi:uncharacterized membrane protein
MKIIKILGHPYALVISFLFLLISGEHLGGFYILYLLIALPHGGLHSILAIIGIAAILVAFHRNIKLTTSALLSIVGFALLIVSVYLFFANDTTHYNSDTFFQTAPLTTFFIFGFIGICFLISQLSHFVRSNNRQIN